MERGRYNRRRDMPRPYSFIIEYTTKNECIRIYGISEGKEQPNDISKIWKYEICISKPRVLVQRILCGYSREKYNSDKKLYRKSTKTGSGTGPDKFIRSKGPVYG